MNNYYPVVGKLKPERTAEALGTGYMQFDNSVLKLGGLAKVSKIPNSPQLRIDILAIISLEPRRGNCRRFFQMLKLHYAWICVWAIDNTDLYDALVRYGFRHCVQKDFLLPTMKIAKVKVKDIDGLEWNSTVNF